MTQDQQIIRAKVGLLELAKQLGNVSQACKMMGCSRDSFSRFKELYDPGGELALQEISRRKPILKNRTATEIEEAAVALAIEQPAWGQVRVSEALKRRGLSISPAGVRCVWQRHDLTSINHRLKALEAKVAQDGILLTAAPIAALEKKAGQGSAWRIRQRVPRLLRRPEPALAESGDTFYVGTLKGVGRVYQQTVIETYAKIGFAKLYDRKTPITAAEILNDRVVPFYDEHGLLLPVRVLSRLFRRLFLAALADAHAADRLVFFGEIGGLRRPQAFAANLASLKRKNWFVSAKPPFSGPEAVLAYLARYTHRVAIANSRLIALDERGVTFRYKDYRRNGQARYRTMMLSADEFIRRFMLHVLPKGFHRIHHYGLPANAGCKANTARARELIAAPLPRADPPQARDAADPNVATDHRPPCPCCGGRMLIVEVFGRGGAPRGPPSAAASGT